MNKGAKTITVLMGASMVASSGLAYAMPAFAQNADQTSAVSHVEDTRAASTQSSYLRVADVQGEFSYDQNQITPNEVIRAVFQKATAAVCNALPRYNFGSIDTWNIEVTGDVHTAFTATLKELSDGDNVETSIMTCACSANQAGGGAIINAEVKGVPVRDLIVQAGIDGNVNTVTFTAADGTQSSLPLSYVLSHGAVIAYEINGEDLSASVGGTNQLWLSGSAGKYFTRDIVKVEFLHLDTPPAAPSFEENGMEFSNRPNVSAAQAN